MATFAQANVIEMLPDDYLQSACSCPCVCGGCDDELVLHDSDGISNYSNDKTTFIFNKELPGDDYDLKLYPKDGTDADGITIDTNIADIYDYGDLPYDTGAILSGFHIKWILVFSLHGNGDYIIRGTITKQGREFDYESHCFKLRTFSCEMARDTVKIEAYQNGYIISERIDLSGTNWLTSIRLPGKLIRNTPKLVTSNYISEGRVQKQIQDRVDDEWTLELWNMKTKFKNLLIYNLILNNDFYVSDYNVNEEKYNRIALAPDSIERVKAQAYNPDPRVTLKLKSRIQDTIKRNFKNKYNFTNDSGDIILIDGAGDYLLWR